MAKTKNLTNIYEGDNYHMPVSGAQLLPLDIMPMVLRFYLNYSNYHGKVG